MMHLYKILKRWTKASRQIGNITTNLRITDDTLIPFIFTDELRPN